MTSSERWYATIEKVRKTVKVRNFSLNSSDKLNKPLSLYISGSINKRTCLWNHSHVSVLLKTDVLLPLATFFKVKKYSNNLKISVSLNCRCFYLCTGQFINKLSFRTSLNEQPDSMTITNVYGTLVYID